MNTPNIKPHFLFILILLALPWAAHAAVTVSNVRAEQIPGTSTVEIYYDVSAKAPTVSVSLEIRDGMKEGAPVVPSASATGHIGANVPKGSNRKITWNAEADWGKWKGTLDMRFEVTATAVMPAGGDPTAEEWEAVNSRWVRNFYANGHITMSDESTGLMWVYDAKANGTANWDAAKTKCNNLTYAGHSDWFLPNKDQLAAMYSQKALFSQVQNARYWSSTPYRNDSYAWNVDMTNGSVDVNYKDNGYWVWPCRGGQ